MLNIKLCHIENEQINSCHIYEDIMQDYNSQNQNLSMARNHQTPFLFYNKDSIFGIRKHAYKCQCSWNNLEKNVLY